jgi:tetratricopeptide (TPR) repeat protein
VFARLGLVLAALVAATRPPAAAADSWAGEIVMHKHDLEELTAAPAGGGPAVPFRPKYMDNLVRRDGGDRLLLRDRGTDWWVRKADFLRPDDAVAYTTATLRARPNDPAAYYVRSVAHHHRGDRDRALADAERALQFAPNAPVYRFNRADIYADMGEPDKAIHDYDMGIGFAPTDDVALAHRGVAWLAKKEYDRAHRDFTEAIRMDARCPEPLVYRAWANRLTGRYNAALFDLDAALRIDDQHPEALAGKAWLLATCPDGSFRDGKRAVDLAARACRVTAWKAGRPISYLAVAHAEAGNFAKAEKALRAALDDRVWAARNRKWAEDVLDLFAAKQPLREVPAKK